VASNGFDPKEHLVNLETNPRKPARLYLETKWRLVWLRQEHPDAQIVTEILAHNPAEQWAIVKATVTVPGRGSATGMVIQSPTAIAKDYVANGETSAIGRALAALGYGTQFCRDFEDGQGVVDSPVGRRPAVDDPPPPVGDPPMAPGDPRPSRAQRERLLRAKDAAYATGRWGPDKLRAFVKDHWGKASLGELTAAETDELAEVLEGELDPAPAAPAPAAADHPL
jgi:hypothetical protein